MCMPTRVFVHTCQHTFGGGGGSACVHMDVDARTWARAGPWGRGGRQAHACPGMKLRVHTCARAWGGVGAHLKPVRGSETPSCAHARGVWGTSGTHTNIWSPPPTQLDPALPKMASPPSPRWRRRPSPPSPRWRRRPPQDGAAAFPRPPQDGGRKWLRSASVKPPRPGSSFQDGGARGIHLVPGPEPRVARSRHRPPPLPRSPQPQEGLEALGRPRGAAGPRNRRLPRGRGAAAAGHRVRAAGGDTGHPAASFEGGGGHERLRDGLGAPRGGHA